MPPSKRLFEELAVVMSHYTELPFVTFARLTNEVADVLADHNPRFDKKRFLEAIVQKVQESVV